jgi:integrase
MNSANEPADVYILPYEIAGRRIHAEAERDAVVLMVDGFACMRIERFQPDLTITRHGGTAITFHDVLGIHQLLDTRVRGETRFECLRLRAFIHLIWSGGLRPREALSLNLHQITEWGPNGKLRVRDTGMLMSRQSSARSNELEQKQHEFPIDPDAKKFLVAYLRLAKQKEWLDVAMLDHPVFISVRGLRGKRGHARWSVRSAEKAWLNKRARIQLDIPYSLHDFRHDAILRCRGTPEVRAQFARVSVRDIKRKYSHPDPYGLSKLRRDTFEAIVRLAETNGYDEHHMRCISSGELDSRTDDSTIPVAATGGGDARLADQPDLPGQTLDERLPPTSGFDAPV